VAQAFSVGNTERLIMYVMFHSAGENRDFR
jgi:hypothetical protein